MDKFTIPIKLKNHLLKEWGKIANTDLLIKQDKTKDKKGFIDFLYGNLKPILKKTIKALDIKIDHNLLEKIRLASTPEQKTIYQKKFIQSLALEFKKFPLGNNVFLPEDIQKIRKFNCAGGTLLIGYLLNQAGIKNYYGLAYRHSVNIAKLSDNSLVYICTRANLKNTVGYKTSGKDKLGSNVVDVKRKISTDINTEIKYLTINQKKIPYRLIMLLSFEEIIFCIIDNMETKKFQNIRKLLFPKIYEFQKNDLWKTERKYVNRPKLKQILRNKYVDNVLNCKTDDVH